MNCPIRDLTLDFSSEDLAELGICSERGEEADPDDFEEESEVIQFDKTGRIDYHLAILITDGLFTKSGWWDW